MPSVDEQGEQLGPAKEERTSRRHYAYGHCGHCGADAARRMGIGVSTPRSTRVWRYGVCYTQVRTKKPNFEPPARYFYRTTRIPLSTTHT